MSKRSLRGFTLIELLVVIAIIAILAAILFPVFSNAKERGRQARCLANEKQLAMAILGYCDDNGGRFPFVRDRGASMQCINWCGSVQVAYWCYPDKGQIWQYVRNLGVYQCPTDSRLAATGINPATIPTGLTNRDFPLSYSMNTAFDSDKIAPVLMSSISRSRQVFMLMHEARNCINDGDLNWITTDVPSGVHYSGTTVLYVDSHAAWQSYDQLKKTRNDGLWSATDTPCPPPVLLP